MKPSFVGLSLLLILTFSWSCSKKQSNAEIPLETPVPTGTRTITVALAPPAATTTALQFDLPSPTPSGPPMEYEVEELQGTVLALLDGATDPVTVEEGETLETGDTLIALDNSQATLNLNDVTAVHVSEGTTVKIADLEPNATQGFISRLELTSGKILSEVEKLDASHSTFEVESGGVVCGVRGTAFEVQNQDGQVITNTFHGAVEVDKDNVSQLVKGGEHSAFVFNKNGFLAKRKLNGSENNRYKAWGRIYKHARQRRSQRMRWIKTHPHSAQARKFIQRRETLRQKRLQFQINRSSPSALGAQAQGQSASPIGEKRDLIHRHHPLLNHPHLENQTREKRKELRKNQQSNPGFHPNNQNQGSGLNNAGRSSANHTAQKNHPSRAQTSPRNQNGGAHPKRVLPPPKKQGAHPGTKPNGSHGNNKKKLLKDHEKEN
jgi:hypothetical protein